VNEVLAFIGERIGRKEITWGLGGSLLLHYYQLTDKPNDIDILVDEKSAHQLIHTISPYGNAKAVIRSKPFQTTHFAKYTIDNIDVDIMSGFAIEHNEGLYKIAFDNESIVDHRSVHGVDIPLCSLEDWYILYWLIPGKQVKALRIENYWKKTGVKHPNLLEKALKQSLPVEVRKRVLNLLALENC
jgi:hypothetical protein